MVGFLPVLLAAIAYPQLKMDAAFVGDPPTYVGEEFYLRIAIYNPTMDEQEEVRFILPVYYLIFSALRGCDDAAFPMRILNKTSGKAVWCGELGAGLWLGDSLKTRPPQDTIRLGKDDTLVFFVAIGYSIGGYMLSESGEYCIEEIAMQWHGDTLIKCTPELKFNLKMLEPDVYADLESLYNSHDKRNIKEETRSFIKSHSDHPIVKAYIEHYFSLVAVEGDYSAEKEVLVLYAEKFPAFFIFSGTYNSLVKKEPDLANQIRPILESGLENHPFANDIWLVAQRAEENFPKFESFLEKSHEEIKKRTER